MKEPKADVVSDLNMLTIRARLAGSAKSSLGQGAWPAADLEPASAPDDKRAAVATVLRDSSEGPQVLLIRRAEHPRDPWSGHMAFPGGRETDTDTNLLATAVRETREELGLDLTQAATLLGCLDMLPAVARGRRVGLSIAPFVFELTEPAALTPNYEVAEWLWTPLSPLFLGVRGTTIPYDFEGTRLALPGFDVEGRVVWGLTYRMLEMLFARLR